MAEILFMENPEIVRSRNMSENDFIDHEDDEDEEDDDSGEYHDFSTMIPHISNSNSQMNPVWQVMSCHGVYLSKFLQLHHTLLHSNSCPLPLPMRHMIAIMSSARLSCSYLVHQHSQELSLLPGYKQCMDKGLSGFPSKIRKLYDLNMLLAHRPWQLTRDHVAQLTQPGQDSWSLSELVYAIILMCHYHCLSSFILSCVIMEPDVSGDMMSSHGCSPGQESYKVEELMKKMKVLRKQQNSPPPQEELRSRFQSLVRVQACDSELCDRPKVESDISQFIQDVNFQYVDFARRQDEFATFRIQDFNWDEEGYSSIARFDEDTAQFLDDKFRTIYNMTYGTMGSHTSIDTSLFRRASWNYIQCVWGVRHDDYDYHEVNELLHRDLKKYIKTSSCYPARCKKSDYENIMKDFKTSEKIHFLLLVSEAKLQSTLLYAMRAVSEYFN